MGQITSWFAPCFPAHHYTELRPSEFYCMFYCSCANSIRQIRSVHRSLSRNALVALIRALVVTKLSSTTALLVLVGVSGTLLRRLVCSQCCGANCVLGEEFGAHNATTPGTSLAEDHGAYSVRFVCPCLPQTVCTVAPHSTSPRHCT